MRKRTWLAPAHCYLLYNDLRMRDWKQVAEGFGAEIPDRDLDRVAASLAAVEEAFRPLVGKIPLETEPAYLPLRLPEVEE